MLAGAREAGQALLEAKHLLPHGQFKAWIAMETTLSYDQAKKYMRVAKRGCAAPFDLSGGINAFLGYPDRHPAPPVVTPTTPSLK